MAINVPTVVVIAAVAALAVGVYALTKAFSFNTRAQRLNGEVSKRALKNSIDQRVEVSLLFKTLRKVNVGSAEYTETLKKIEAMQPGITKEYNLQAGALDDMNRAEKALTKSIIKRAEEQARAELLSEKVRERIEREQDGPGFMDYMSSISSYIQSFQTAGLIQAQSAEDIKNADIASLKADEQFLSDQISETLNPKKATAENMSKTITENKESVTVDFKNLPYGVAVNGSSGANILMPTTGSTSGR